MKFIFIITCCIFSIFARAENKMTAEVEVKSLTFTKPLKGVGSAGLLIFTTANVNNNGILLNLNNENHYFDSKIFIRPTFIGFTTKLGNYGFTIETDNIINSVDKADFIKSKLVVDEHQLYLSGEHFSFLNSDSSIKLQNFLLYCQKMVKSEFDKDDDMMANCLTFLTLNGNYAPNNGNASFDYEGLTDGVKTTIKAEITSLDLRKNQINLNLKSANTTNNDSYFSETTNLNLNCDKDEALKTLDFKKIKYDCLNRLKVAPFKVTLIDKLEQSTFKLDIKDITVKEEIVYFSLSSGILSDAISSTRINNLLMNCRKEIETDLFDLTKVLKDCLSYSRLSIAEIQNSKADSKDSSIKHITINSTNGALILQAEVSFLGIKAQVVIRGSISLNELNKKLIINVTDTKLPLGINSVNLLMYILKKNIISKEITIQNNNINIQY